LKSRESQPKVFHASSGACFGCKSLNRQDPIEGSKAEFISSRIDVENLLINDSELTGFELSVARLFTFSGNLLLKKNHYAITDFIKSGIGTGTVQVTGNPETVRSYMHQAAMAEWILQALVSPESERDLQIGSSEPVTIGELAEFIAEQTGATVDYVPNAQPKDVYLPNNEKTRTKLGLNEGLNWKLSVQEMIDTVRKGKDVSN
jgi:nucleoside-diphosphate-sugar epimerase